MVRLKKINKKNNGVYSCYFANDINPDDYNYFECDVINKKIISAPDELEKYMDYEKVIKVFERFESGELKIPENGEYNYSWY